MSLMIFTVQAQSAETCTAVDLRAQVGPSRDQLGTSWCYAHSAADMISQALGFRVSAFDLAATYLLADESQLRSSKEASIRNYLVSRPDFFERLERWRNDQPKSYRSKVILTEDGLYDLGGMDDDTILLSNVRGLCREKALPGGEANDRHREAVVTAYKSRDQRLDEGRKKPIGTIPGKAARIKAHVFQEWVDQKCHPRIFPSEALIPGGVYGAPDLQSFYESIEAGQLDQNKVHREMFAAIDQQLDHGRVASIGFDAYDVIAPDTYLSWRRRGRAPNRPDDGDHASIIAARRMMNGQCHYYLRVHYGPGCDFYQKALRRQCVASDGGIWVSAETLKTVYSVLWLEKSRSGSGGPRR